MYSAVPQQHLSLGTCIVSHGCDSVNFEPVHSRLPTVQRCITIMLATLLTCRFQGRSCREPKVIQHG